MRNLVPLLRYAAPRTERDRLVLLEFAGLTAHGDSDGAWARFAIMFEPGEVARPAAAVELLPEDDARPNLGLCHNAYPNPNDALDPKPYAPGSYPRLKPYTPPAAEQVSGRTWREFLEPLRLRAAEASASGASAKGSTRRRCGASCWPRASWPRTARVNSSRAAADEVLDVDRLVAHRLEVGRARVAGFDRDPGDQLGRDLDDLVGGRVPPDGPQTNAIRSSGSRRSGSGMNPAPAKRR